MPYLYLAIAIVSEVFATTLLKTTNGFRKPGLTGLVLLGYGVALFCLSKCIAGENGIKIGIAYAIWAGVGTALIAVLASVIYQQKLDLAAIAGIALIVIGVAIVNLFSNVSDQSADARPQATSTVDRDASDGRS